MIKLLNAKTGCREAIILRESGRWLEMIKPSMTLSPGAPYSELSLRLSCPSTCPPRCRPGHVASSPSQPSSSQVLPGLFHHTGRRLLPVPLPPCTPTCLVHLPRPASVSLGLIISFSHSFLFLKDSAQLIYLSGYFARKGRAFLNPQSWHVGGKVTSLCSQRGTSFPNLLY